MNGSWSGPGFSLTEPELNTVRTTNGKKVGPKEFPQTTTKEEKYHVLVIDSGAIIKHTGFSRLHGTASNYVTTQGVMNEIRDSKARSHLESLPFDLDVKEPTAEGVARVVEFAKKTGDYASLSTVDLSILALLYDLEKEGCHSMEHIRTEPKRVLTGRVTAMNKDRETSTKTVDCGANQDAETHAMVAAESGAAFFQGKFEAPEEGDQTRMQENEESKQKEDEVVRNAPPIGRSWASLVNPSASTSVPVPVPVPGPTSQAQSVRQNTSIAAQAMATTFGSMSLGAIKKESTSCGQFSDAEDDESLGLPYADDCSSSNSSDDENGEEYASIGEDFSDEECDIYILDPEEVEARKKGNDTNITTSSFVDLSKTTTTRVSEELEMEFPSLLAASTVPYEGSDDESNTDALSHADRLKRAAEQEAKRREASLKPVTHSGKLYSSFKKYKDIVSSSGVNIDTKTKDYKLSRNDKIVKFQSITETQQEPAVRRDTGSRVIGGSGFSGQSTEVDDDGEGWVTSTKDITSMKAAGVLDPFGNRSNQSVMLKTPDNLPAKSCRAACATTDFAMQNVILQMNLELLSVDGVKVRKLKSWVTRCAACFRIYTGSDNDGKRLFCSDCGSSSLQRIAASVDGKTGRLKLHLKKNFKTKTRGTQFALPKPGTQNRFMGDLLLCEDQLMYGAWNQKVKMTRSKKEKESIFGSDIAATVGCHKDLTKREDIKVGFGRKNPNSSKFGRERRGKKKKSTDKACGLRRY